MNKKIIHNNLKKKYIDTWVFLKSFYLSPTFANKKEVCLISHHKLRKITHITHAISQLLPPPSNKACFTQAFLQPSDE